MNQEDCRFRIKASILLTSIVSFQSFSLFTDFREDIISFSANLNVNIPDVKSLLAAFTHESYLIANADKLTEPHECNEKLAFLGKT